MLKENLNKVFHVICPFNSQLNASEESGEKQVGLLTVLICLFEIRFDSISKQNGA